MDVESRELSGSEEVKGKEKWDESPVRSLLWVLRRGEVKEASDDAAKVERRRDDDDDDDVEERLDGCREEQEGFERVVAIRDELGVRSLFSRLRGAKLEDKLLPHEAPVRCCC